MSVTYRLPYDTPLRYLPLVYILPHELLLRCPTLRKLPRRMGTFNCFTSITKDGRLSAKEILGNRAQLSKWQDEFHAHMSKAFPALQRGESDLVTKRKHIPTWLFKQSIDLTRQ